MTVFLVRHASAGHRDDADPHDLERRLDGAGRRQAQKIMGLLACKDVGWVASSPAARCVGTISPLADACELDVEETDDLLEGADIERSWALLELAAKRDDDAVLCSHGDVIPDLIRRAQTRGMEVRGKAGCSKGSVWALHWDGVRFTKGTYTSVRD